eukprot:898682-Pleurochrysis_carterae.AAC.1
MCKIGGTAKDQGKEGTDKENMQMCIVWLSPPGCLAWPACPRANPVQESRMHQPPAKRPTHSTYVNLFNA